MDKEVDQALGEQQENQVIDEVESTISDNNFN